MRRSPPASASPLLVGVLTLLTGLAAPRAGATELPPPSSPPTVTLPANVAPAPASGPTAAENASSTLVGLDVDERMEPYRGGPLPKGTSLVFRDDPEGKAFGMRLFLGGYVAQAVAGVLIAAVVFSSTTGITGFFSAVLVAGFGLIPVVAPVLFGLSLLPAILASAGPLPLVMGLLLLAMAGVEVWGQVMVATAGAKPYLCRPSPPPPAQLQGLHVLPESLVLARF